MHLTSRVVIPTTLYFVLSSANAEVTYTYLDFEYLRQRTDTSGLQSTPSAGQFVSVKTDEGDGVSVSGSMAMGERFYLSGSFRTAIIDVSGVVTNPLGTTDVMDDFDLISGRLGLGYQRPLNDELDLVFELSYDWADYDFGSFAGENFDMDDGGAGARVGFRWGPSSRFELSAIGHFTTIETADLNALEFESDTLLSVGAFWYFFEDLGIGLQYEAGEVDILTVSMRFSFGDLPW